MKPAPFTYHRPESRAEVDDLLAQHGDEAKILAGGQSLIPILNMRLASPGHLIDINHMQDELPEPVEAGGEVIVGPVVRHEAVERSPSIQERVPLLSETMPFVAHPAIRSRGTVAGSMAHADPAAELPAVLAVLGGSVVARRKGGSRTIQAADFFAGPLENSLAPDEWVQEVRWPMRVTGAGYAFEEFARRRGDYALCGVAAMAAPADGNNTLTVSLSYLGMGDVPERLETEPIKKGDDAEDAVTAVVSDCLDAPADIHASPEYRMHLARRLGVRAARRAIAATGLEE
jgi:aerobic carbon-monoxide dehydrogenase medium subunit